MNDVTKFAGTGTGLMARDALVGALNRAATTIPVKGGEYQYLKLDKGDGAWVYGQEENEIGDDLLAVNPLSFQWGYIAWDDANVEGEVMVPITRELPVKDSLKQVNGPRGWEEQRSVNMVGVAGDTKGVQIQYKQGSVGAMKFFHKLTNAVLDRVQAGEDAIVPIIKLGSEDYKHKKYGRIYNPTFEIVEWRTMDDGSAPAAKPAEAASTTVEPDEDEDAKLEAEYAREQQAAAAATDAIPRRRQRRTA